MRPLSLISTALALLLCTGCFKHSIRDERKPPGTPTSDEWKPYVVAGLAPLGKSTVTTNCTGGIALFESRTSFANGLVALLTFNVFTPITVAYACAEGDQPAPPPAEPPAPEEDAYDVPIL